MSEQSCCETFTSKCIEKLRAKGHRMTKTRLQVIAGLEDMDGQFTSRDLHQHMTSKNSRFDFATVYRNLLTLADLGIIHSIPNMGTYIRCSLEHTCNEESLHGIYRCDSCDKLEEKSISSEYAQSLFSMSEHGNPGFKVRNAVIEFNGLCESCSPVSKIN